MNNIKLAQQVFNIEVDAIVRMSEQLGDSFNASIEAIMNCNGRLVVLGMGKSGIIGRKISATMSSTGTPSFSVHPGEAFHGDLGMIKPSDVALMISNSGETEELIRLLPFMQYQGNKIIAMTGDKESTLAKYSNSVLDISVPREACNNNLAPTSSTTAALVMGDALAVVLSKLKNFQLEDFARFHPGGSLGRSLLTKVSDVMHKKNLPICSATTPFREFVNIITQGRLGLVLVTDNSSVSGIISDGDLRRVLEQNDDPLSTIASEIMTTNPHTVLESERCVVAEQMMRDLKKRALVVVDIEDKVVGVLQIFDRDS